MLYVHYVPNSKMAAIADGNLVTNAQRWIDKAATIPHVVAANEAAIIWLRALAMQGAYPPEQIVIVLTNGQELPLNQYAVDITHTDYTVNDTTDAAEIILRAASRKHKLNQRKTMNADQRRKVMYATTTAAAHAACATPTAKCAWYGEKEANKDFWTTWFNGTEQIILQRHYDEYTEDGYGCGNLIGYTIIDPGNPTTVIHQPESLQPYKDGGYSIQHLFNDGNGNFDRYEDPRDAHPDYIRIDHVWKEVKAFYL